MEKIAGYNSSSWRLCPHVCCEREGSGLRRLTIFQILCCWQTLSNYCHSQVKQTCSEFSTAGVLQLGVNICQCMSGTLNSLYEQRHGDSQRCAGLTSGGKERKFMRLFSGFFEGSDKAKNCEWARWNLVLKSNNKDCLVLSKPDAESSAIWFKC